MIPHILLKNYLKYITPVVLLLQLPHDYNVLSVQVKHPYLQGKQLFPSI